MREDNVSQDAQGFASAVKAVGKQAGIGFMQRVADIVKLGSLGHDEYILSVSVQPRQSVAGGAPPAAWQGPGLKISKTEFRDTSQWVLFQWFGKLQNECCTTAQCFDFGAGAMEAMASFEVQPATRPVGRYSSKQENREK